MGPPEGTLEKEKGLTRQVGLKCRRSLTALVLLITFAAGGCVRPTEVGAAPALPGAPCQVEPRATWSETEKWVWIRVCGGQIADLNAHFDVGGSPIGPQSTADW